MGSLIWFSQILCLCFMLFHFRVECSSLSQSSPNSPPHLCHPKEHLALLDFKGLAAMQGCPSHIARHPAIETWNGSIDCCLWEGITCNKMTGHVISLDLHQDCMGIVLIANASLFPNSTLFYLEKLQSLNLAYNYVNYFDISFRFQNWKSLTYLNLSGIVGFMGDSLLFEISLLPKLVSLDLTDNFLVLDDPKFQMLVHNLTELKHLILDFVNMSQVVTASFLNLTSSLEQLSLQGSSLQGNFPTQVFGLPSLQILDLSGNTNLRVNLPKSNWSSLLKYLSLSDISFFGDQLPQSLGNLKLLEEFILSGCQFYGSIPKSLANLTEITYLNFESNHLQGCIPNVFGKMRKLSYLNFRANNFVGEIPASIFNLRYLSYLDLSSNKLEGAHLEKVSGLSHLREFHMANNFLTGRVSSLFFSHPSLVLLDVSHNRLTGPFDHIQQPSLILNEIYLSHNEISGSIPNSFFDLVNLSRVDLSSNNLSGTITPNMLSKLVNLWDLDLSNNNLLSLSNNGIGINYTFPSLEILAVSSCNIYKFPSFLMEARGLVSLNLSKNFLTTVHTELFGLENLSIVDVSSNLLQGSLPVLSTTSSLQALFLSRNNLTGEIPPSFCNYLTSLVVLDLANNILGGKIPECFGNFSHLSILELRMNNFHGRIPNSFVNMNQMNTLSLNDNQLEGMLPLSLANCSSLTIIDVGNNYLNDTFPHWLSVLPSLQVLILRSNRFHSSISNSMTAVSSFSQLKIIDISHNEFEGLLPTEYFQNFKGMKDAYQNEGEVKYIDEDEFLRFSYEYSAVLIMKGSMVEVTRIFHMFSTIDFSSNRFHGEIPKELGELNFLILLNLSHNSLCGQIPSSLGKMTELESLDLSSNKLEGRIPEKLTTLTFLSVLNLSQNKLEGHIPQGKQFDTFSNDSYIGNSGLCGLPLTKKCHNEEEPGAPPSKFNEEDDSPTLFEWKFALAGYGCGLVLGLSLGYIAFTTGKPWWVVKKVEKYQQKFVERFNHRHKKRKTQKPNQHS